MEALRPKAAPGLAVVPSLEDVEVGIALVVAWLDVALDLDRALAASHFFLSLGGGKDPFFLAFAACLPFFAGEMLDISSQRCFSLMTTPFAVEVAPLGSPLPSPFE